MEKKLLLVYESLLDPRRSVDQIGSSTHTFQCILCLNRDTVGTWSTGGKGWEHMEHGQDADAKIGAQAPRQACTGWSEK